MSSAASRCSVVRPRTPRTNAARSAPQIATIYLLTGCACLTELGGGSLKEGWLESEERVRLQKKFEKRWFVAWPADWKKMGQTGPRLFGTCSSVFCAQVRANHAH